MSTKPGSRFRNTELDPQIDEHPSRAIAASLVASGYVVVVLAASAASIPRESGTNRPPSSATGRPAARAGDHGHETRGDDRPTPMREARRTGVGLLVGGLLTLLAVLLATAV